MGFIEKVMAHPVVAHILRANGRYNNRLGKQFAGAITYFSVLAMVPILMFAFAITGMFLTLIRPDLLGVVLQTVEQQLQGPGAELAPVIEEALRNWAGVGVVGILSAFYSGAGWIGNLKEAVRTQMRVDFEDKAKKANIVVETLKNMGSLLLLLVMIVVTFAISQVATSLSGVIVDATGIDQVPGMTVLLRLVPLVASVIAGWFLFLFLYTALPIEPIQQKAKMKGALIGSVGLAVLQYATGLLMSSFSGNPAAALFGPVIVLMLFFNLFAQLILFVAAWIATANQPAVARKYLPADEPLRQDDDTLAVSDHWENAQQDKIEQEDEKAEAEAQRAAALQRAKSLVGQNSDQEPDQGGDTR